MASEWRTPAVSWLVAKLRRLDKPLPRIGGSNSRRCDTPPSETAAHWCTERHPRSVAGPAPKSPSGSAENSSEAVLIDDRHRKSTHLSERATGAGARLQLASVTDRDRQTNVRNVRRSPPPTRETIVRFLPSADLPGTWQEYPGARIFSERSLPRYADTSRCEF